MNPALAQLPVPLWPRLCAIAGIVLACLALVGPAQAQVGRPGSGWGVSAGLRVGRDFENHAWSLGGQAAIPLTERIQLRPSGDYFLGDRSPFRWQLNADAAYSFGPHRRVYAGAGAAFTRVRGLSSLKTGHNLFFGILLAEAEARSKLFLEFRWSFVNRTSPFRLVFGVNQSL